MNAAVSRATCSSGDTISIASFPTRRRARKIAPKAIPFLKELREYLEANVDADEIDRTGEIPQKNIDDLFAMGAFAVKIPTQYGGLGLSQMNYGRAAMLLGSWDANLTALVSAHQSIGVPQPLLIFGTEEQKAKYLPRVARKEISAFALTETNAGSDPANMSLRAEPTRGRLGLHPERRETLVHELDQSRRSRGDGEDGAEDGQGQGAQTDHGVHRRGRFARARDHLSLPLHGAARALQRHRQIHERPRPAREPDREGRAGIEGRPNDSEYRPPNDSGSLRRFVETAARNLPQMGRRTRAMGRADRSALRDRRARSRRWRATSLRWKRSRS